MPLAALPDLILLPVLYFSPPGFSVTGASFVAGVGFVAGASFVAGVAIVTCGKGSVMQSVRSAATTTTNRIANIVHNLPPFIQAVINTAAGDAATSLLATVSVKSAVCFSVLALIATATIVPTVLVPLSMGTAVAFIAKSLAGTGAGQEAKQQISASEEYNKGYLAGLRASHQEYNDGYNQGIREGLEARLSPQ